MYYLSIRFPFQSVNDEQYILALVINSLAYPEAVDILPKIETTFFKRLADSTVGGDTVYNFEGTLTGSVKAVDDERDNTLEPLVCSKLTFNMAVENFPTWLMGYCDNNRIKAIVYKDEGLTLHEMWRGYLMAQSLNMTVVNNYLSVALVAVDEVAMAKYMNFAETVAAVTSERWCSIYRLMQIYNTLHYTEGVTSAAVGFDKAYSILGLTPTGLMLWNNNIRIFDDDDTEVTDIPNAFHVNLDRWLSNEEATWETVFQELLEYLGVTFAVGSFGSLTDNDAYLLSNTLYQGTAVKYVYDFEDDSFVTTSASVFATMNNPTKVGANFQMTSEPAQYKKVVVTSTPERWEAHKYLTDEHYKEIAPTKFVRYEWGEGDDPPTQLDSYNWHKLRYIKPDAEEADFVEIPACADGEGYLMARDGLLPYDDLDSCSGLTEPDWTIADSLDFITFKEGCVCVKIGEGQVGGIDEDKMLTPYFMLLNHMWANMYNLFAIYPMQTQHVADTPWLKLFPLGAAAPVHPTDKHYLKLEMKVSFIRENMPSDTKKKLYLKAVGGSNQEVNWTTPAILMPAETSLCPFADNTMFWYELYFEAYIRIGSWYYNGTTWAYVGSGQTPPKCHVTMWNSGNQIQHATLNGDLVITTGTYYYAVSMPYRGSNVIDRYNNTTSLLTDVGSLSTHGQPLEGRLEMQILGQVRFQDQGFVPGSAAGYNSIPFILLNDIESTYTDEAEFIDKDIKNTTEMEIDENSKTKEVLEKSLSMASPAVAGFFNNCLLYDGGKAWHNVSRVWRQAVPTSTTLERLRCMELAWQYSTEQLYVEFSTPVAFDDNVHNVGFMVYGLTEAEGNFMPVKREFDFTKETMRVKLLSINNAIYN